MEVTNRLQQRENARAEIVANAAGNVGGDELGEAAQAKAQAALEGQELDEMKLAEERVSVFENAFEKIKDATGVSDINEVIHKIVNQEDTQSNLMTLTKENQGKIEVLRQNLEDSHARVDEIKYSGTGVTQKRKLVDDHEANLTAAAAKLERTKAKAERMAAVLINVKAGIEHVADRIEGHREQDQQPLQMTDETVVEILFQCESTLYRLLSEAKKVGGAGAESDVLAAMGGGGGSRSSSPEQVPGSVLAQQVTDRQVMETRPFNQRVTLPSGDMGLDRIAEEDGGDDMDGAAAAIGDEDELTRDKIKKASSQFTIQHDRAQRKKEKKKKKKR